MHAAGRPGIAQWGSPRGSICLAGSELPIAVPEPFGLSTSSGSRRCQQASAAAVQQFPTRRPADRQWLVRLLEGKTFTEDQLVIARGVTSAGEKRVLGLVQTATESRRTCATARRVYAADIAA